MFGIFEKKSIALIFILAGAAVPVAAQGDTGRTLKERLLDCNDITDRLDELACYDAIVDSLDENPVAEVAEPDATMAVQTETAVSSALIIVPAAVATESAAATAPRAISADHDSPDAAVAAAVPAQVSRDTARPQVVAETVVVEDSKATREDSDSEQVRKAPKFEPFEATIVDVWRTADDRFAVKLDNNQTWRETAGSRITIPKKGWTVKVTKGSFGGYRMKIENRKRLASVRLQD